MKVEMQVRGGDTSRLTIVVAFRTVQSALYITYRTQHLQRQCRF